VSPVSPIPPPGSDGSAAGSIGSRLRMMIWSPWPGRRPGWRGHGPYGQASSCRTRTGGHGWQQMWRCLNGRGPTPLPARGIRRGRPSGLALQLLGTSDVGVSGIQGEWLRLPAPARAGRLALLGDPYLCHPLLLPRSRRSRSLPSRVAGKWPGVAMASTRMSTRRAVIQGYRLAGTIRSGDSSPPRRASAASPIG
jgi:hypothetical protein